VKLQVDSGVASIVLFTSINMSTEISGGQSIYSIGGILGGSLAQEERASMLRLGGKVYRNLRVFVPKIAPSGMDIDGVLPTSLFSAIFISHSGEFVIVDPCAKPVPLESKSPGKSLGAGEGIKHEAPAPRKSRAERYNSTAVDRSAARRWERLNARGIPKNLSSSKIT
jgi:hypothetical protein